MDYSLFENPQKSKVIKIVVITILTFVLGSYFKSLITKKTKNQSQNKIVLEQISNIVYYGILVFGFILVLIEVGVQKTTIYTLLVSVGFTIGISLQTLLSRGLSGIYIIMMNLYDIGDNIKINNNVGVVKSFNLFNTTVYNNTGKIDIVIPNDMIGENELINYTRSQI